MGLLDNQIQSQYYSGNNFGDYQFTTLDNIINAFMFTYVGESKIINKVNRTDVQFHAMRAVQELSYDVFRSIKTQEVEVPATLIMPLPHDYVNYVKLSKVESDGVERVLYPTGKTSNPFAIEQVDGVYQFQDNNILDEQGSTSLESDTWKNFKTQISSNDEDVNQAMDIEYDNRGRRYGLDPQYAQSNGTFFIDYRKGYIHFGASLSGDTVVLRYISDGLGTDAEMVVHKFAEEAVYKSIAYGVLSTRSNVPEYIVARFKKERFAETRKAKIRLSNIKIEEFAQVIKGMGKQIK